MNIRRNNGSEVSPSIVSKVKHALNLKRSTPKNSKTCSRELWEELVDIIGPAMDCSPREIQEAKEKYIQYMQITFEYNQTSRVTH